ncbi:hypothetical protein SCLCIDRAFT_187520 [Scleroderma citrinum Foug A]|uniref:Cytochrome P450 n=1 Tax=Scleroderma citrinum Foug A TaxID=1036808 RepID=A0A0C3DLQ3_9AGAM|nr:hypothetical protein SCLCIDRAFT_187520 [Scleroderma citrinum Foug A]
MGLLDVNMPMLYGEGKKAFHRLQLEIIRTSNDHSIFAWGCNEINVRTGGILADDTNFFRGCNEMELMDRNEFIESLRRDMDIPEEELPSTEDDRLGTFPITNSGIQIWRNRPYWCRLLYTIHKASDWQSYLPHSLGPSMDFSTPILYSTLVALLAFVALRAWKPGSSTRRRGLRSLPGPKCLPFIGNLLDIDIAAPWLTYTEWGKRYGGIVHCTLLGHDFVIINDKKTVHEILEQRSEIYADRPSLSFVDS